MPRYSGNALFALRYLASVARGPIALVILCALCAQTGCGAGALTQDQMVARAIKRTTDAEEEAAAATAAKAQPAAVMSKEDQPAAAARRSAAPDVPDDRHLADSSPESAPKEESGGDQQDSAPEPPEELRDPGQLLSRSEWNLERIGLALAKYSEQHKGFPIAANESLSNHPLLSWRVRLLPYLGYHTLYNKFHLDEPWNSPNNRPLVEEIPPVYSLGLPDGKTTYLAPISTSSLLGQKHAVRVMRVEDGVEHTLVVLDCVDQLAVEWTRPLDVEIAKVDVTKILSDRRFVVWANGMVGQMRPGIAVGKFLSYFSYDGGEPYTSWEACVFKGDDQTGSRYAAAPPAGGEQAGAASNGKNTVVQSPGSGVSREDQESVRSGSDRKGGLSVGDAPLPTPEEREVAKAKFRTHFARRYDQAKNDEERIELARLMLEQSDQLAPASPDRFVSLELVSQIAAAAGDLKLALEAVSAMQQTFATDLYEPHIAVLEKYLTSNDKSNSKTAFDRSLELVDQALESDDYSAAERLLAVCTSLAGRNASSLIRTQLRQRRTKLEDNSARYARVRRALQVLESEPENPEANQVVGGWLCFVREEWPAGLPLLAKSVDRKLQEAAMLEAQVQNDPLGQLELADRWFEYSAKNPADAVNIRKRAAFWYSNASPQLQGLEKLKAEVQLKEIDRLNGVASKTAASDPDNR